MVPGEAIGPGLLEGEYQQRAGSYDEDVAQEINSTDGVPSPWLTSETLWPGKVQPNDKHYTKRDTKLGGWSADGKKWEI